MLSSLDFSMLRCFCTVALRADRSRNMPTLTTPASFACHPIHAPSNELGHVVLFSRRTAVAASGCHYHTHPSSLPRVRVTSLTDDELAVLGEIVLGDLEVQRRGALAYTSGDVVVGTVAGAEPATEVAGLADGHTSQMRADT